MLHDMERYKETDLLTRVRKERPPSAPDVEFNVVVLTQGMWPPSLRVWSELQLPAALRYYADAFAVGFHSGTRKKLSWLHGYGRVELRMACVDGVTRLLSVNTLQTAVLLALDAGVSLSVAEVREQCNALLTAAMVVW